MVSKCMKGCGRGRKRQRGSCPVERGVDKKVVRKRLVLEAQLPSGAMVMSGPGMLPGAISGSMALPQL